MSYSDDGPTIVWLSNGVSITLPDDYPPRSKPQDQWTDAECKAVADVQAASRLNMKRK